MHVMCAQFAAEQRTRTGFCGVPGRIQRWEQFTVELQLWKINETIVD